MTDRTSRLLGALTENRHLLILTISMVVVAGISAFLTLPRIEDPRITTRNAVIITPFPGASASRVEALVTKKIEDKLRELAEIKTTESTSRKGISVVSIKLQDGVGAPENERIFSKVRDRIAQAANEMPAGAGRPELDEMRGAVAYSMIVALSGNSNLGMLNRYAELLGDRLRSLSGTEQVVLFGAPSEELLVDVNAPELAALGLSPADLASRIAAADTRRSAGVVRHKRRDLPLELSGALDSTARVAAIPVADDGQGGLISVGDIAAVRKQWADPPEQIALHEGRRSVLLAVRTEGNIRLDRWAAAARAAIGEFGEGLDPSVRLETVFDQSRYTEERLSSLGSNLIAGAAVVVVVVFFMMGWRAALIVGSALPLSAGATLFGLTLFGEPIHQMSIFGMIIAIGLLIDNAIIMTDKVVAHRRDGASAVEAVSRAVGHLFSPLLASTLTTVLGFMPIFLLPGNIGDFVGPIAIAVILALMASFVLSMTVIPALAGLLVHAEHGNRRWWRDGVPSARLGVAYRDLLVLSLRRPMRTLVVTTLLPIAGFVLASRLGMEFFPPADRDQLEIQVWMPSGTSVGTTEDRLGLIEAAIREHAGIRQLTWVAGADSPPVYYNQLRLEEHRPEYARGVVQVADSAMAKALEATLQKELAGRFADAQVVVKAFGQGPPITAPVGFRIFGPSPHQLRRLGEQLRALLHQFPEVTHTRASVLGGEPKLWFSVDEQQAQLAGLSLGGIAGQFQAALDGHVGGRVLEDLEDMPIRIRYRASSRDSLDEVASLRLSTATAGNPWVSAAAFGELTLRPELAGITRYDGERVNEIHAFLRQGALPIEVTRAVQARLAEGAVELPPGYRIETAGDSAEQRQAVSQLLAYAPVLAMLMLSSLVLSFRSFALASLIGLVAVLSVGLGMLSLWGGGYPLGFNPILGTAGLIGVAINASIVVLAAILANQKARSGGTEAIVDETVDATRHIVSTTLTTVAGFIPLLAFSGGNFWPPLAVVIAGGVGLSVVLSLFFTPAAYYLLARRKRNYSEPVLAPEMVAR